MTLEKDRTLSVLQPFEAVTDPTRALWMQRLRLPIILYEPMEGPRYELPATLMTGRFPHLS